MPYQETQMYSEKTSSKQSELVILPVIWTTPVSRCHPRLMLCNSSICNLLVHIDLSKLETLKTGETVSISHPG